MDWNWRGAPRSMQCAVCGAPFETQYPAQKICDSCGLAMAPKRAACSRDNAKRQAQKEPVGPDRRIDPQKEFRQCQKSYRKSDTWSWNTSRMPCSLSAALEVAVSCLTVWCPVGLVRRKC